jgi:hypothetical protein
MSGKRIIDGLNEALAHASSPVADVFARVQRVAAPDPELDQAIFAAVYGWSFPLHGAAVSDYISRGRPAYTATLDAARTLIPPEHSFALFDHDAKLGGSAGAKVGHRTARAEDVPWVYHPDPVLALCAAALMARMAMECGR